MNAQEFRDSLAGELPSEGLPVPLAALWWDAKGEWEVAHNLVDELETTEGMAVHAYLHRKAEAASNADYWYERAGRRFQRETFDAEWEALVEGLSGK
ncbi:MAG: hypothetical protein ABSC48_10250 [Terracidiphilus sp.]|jgi:hypothetical protein